MTEGKVGAGWGVGMVLMQIQQSNQIKCKCNASTQLG